MKVRQRMLKLRHKSSRLGFCQFSISVKAKTTAPSRNSKKLDPWTDSTFMLETSFGDVQIEWGHHPYRGPSSSAPLLVLPASEFSYKTFSRLSVHLPQNFCSRLCGVNLPNRRQSDIWKGVPTLDDYSNLLSNTLQKLGPLGPNGAHILAHSQGSYPALAGAGLPSPPPIASITLFEPNTFFLLAAGTQNERRILQEEGGAWCNKVEQFWLKNNQEEEELPSTELCNEMNRFFHHFWNYDDWDTVPEKRLQWFNPDRMTLADQRRWRLEVMSILNTWRNPDEEVADQMLRNLSTIPSKRIILSPLPGPGSRNLLQALADLLSREAGFVVETAPVGGHLGLVTHQKEIFPKLFQ